MTSSGIFLVGLGTSTIYYTVTSGVVMILLVIFVNTVNMLQAKSDKINCLAICCLISNHYK